MLTSTPTSVSPPDLQPITFPRYPASALNLEAGALFHSSAVPLRAGTAFPWAFSTSHPITISFLDSTIALLAAAATIVLHEYIHGCGIRLHGYQVYYGVHWRKFMAYAGVFEQPMQRQHVLQIALAPVLIITVAMLPLLAFPNRYVVLVAFSALLANTTGSVGDLYLVWHVQYLPRWALSDIEPRQSWIWAPFTAGECDTDTPHDQDD